jgi:hypothetical protein
MNYTSRMNNYIKDLSEYFEKEFSGDKNRDARKVILAEFENYLVLLEEYPQLLDSYQFALDFFENQFRPVIDEIILKKVIQKVDLNNDWTHLTTINLFYKMDLDEIINEISLNEVAPSYLKENLYRIGNPYLNFDQDHADWDFWKLYKYAREKLIDYVSDVKRENEKVPLVYKNSTQRTMMLKRDELATHRNEILKLANAFKGKLLTPKGYCSSEFINSAEMLKYRNKNKIPIPTIKKWIRIRFHSK